jgi:hypothetical protein
MTTKINAELVKILSKDKSMRPEAEQILERLSVQKDSLPTARQKESLLFCCKLLDSAVALDDAIQQTLEKVEEKPDAEYVSQPESGIANQVVGIALAPRAMPGLITQGNTSIEGIPLDLEGSMTHLWDETLGQRVDQDAAAIVKAPFDAINDASESIAPDKLYKNYRGRYFHDMKVKLDSPEMIAYAKDLAKGKKSST